MCKYETLISLQDFTFIVVCTEAHQDHDLFYFCLEGEASLLSYLFLKNKIKTIIIKKLLQKQKLEEASL